MANREMTPEILGPKYAVRLGDLRSWHILKITCLACRHEQTLYLARLQAKWSEHERIMDLEPKFRCTGCGQRAGVSWQVYRLQRD